MQGEISALPGGRHAEGLACKLAATGVSEPERLRERQKNALGWSTSSRPGLDPVGRKHLPWAQRDDPENSDDVKAGEGDTAVGSGDVHLKVVTTGSVQSDPSRLAVGNPAGRRCGNGGIGRRRLRIDRVGAVSWHVVSRIAGDAGGGRNKRQKNKGSAMPIRMPRRPRRRAARVITKWFPQGFLVVIGQGVTTCFEGPADRPCSAAVAQPAGRFCGACCCAIGVGCVRGGAGAGARR